MNTPTYWLIFGYIYLIYLIYVEYKNFYANTDKQNYFMSGITVSLFTHYSNGLFYIICLTLTYVGLSVLFAKNHIFNKSTLHTLSWLFIGYGIISLQTLITYVIIFIGITFLYATLKRVICIIGKLNYKNPLPFYPIILLSYIVTNLFVYVL